MTDTSQFFDIVIFAMIAVFLGLRLRSVLGRRNPDQEPVSGGQRLAAVDRPSATVIDLPADPLTGGLARIKAKDAGFDRDQFLNGAGMAFEMIVRAFAAGDLATLQPLLSESVFKDFKAAIDARAGNPTDDRMELLRIVSATLNDASLTGSIAEISVRFVSEQRSANGTELRLIDLWRFSRNLANSDPNWRLVATGSLES